ncbi:hypothetical protein ONS95_004059 [Cadophora gregata]|uniref:uncharacterized protein n=1 Tax=Cadophora gregata TaxID=51156 RepID=UPI0026DB2CFA|nr:uncharacterized protein ONS95_004059 [Cadophora gregata]KAK0107366.1 hypothetical protein ONS95_004059 [Cadophora gregata]KAK0117044.1 hypothetical protein ONS96_012886 [Cadophora gregata f. sp. sojae]
MMSPDADEVFEDCIEAPPANTPNTTESEKKPSGFPSSPATKDGDRGGSKKPKTPRERQIQQKFQAARTEYERKRYVACREKCMDLLRQRNLPRVPRCLTLQLFASCSYYYGAKNALEQALKIASQLGDLDADGEVRRDIEELLEELEQYRPNAGEPRIYIKELEEDEY